MRRRIVRAIVLATAVAIVVLIIPLGIAVSRLYQQTTLQGLVDHATRAGTAVPGPPVSAADRPEIAAVDDGSRIAIYTADGTRVAGDGPARADAMTFQALRGSVSSGSAGGEVVAAVPVGSQEQIVAAVRAAVPQSAVDDRVHRAWEVMAATGIGAIIVAIGVAIVQARRLSRPLDVLTAAAKRLGDGDFSARIDPTGLPEFDAVGGAMTSTAERLSGVLERERAFSADASHQLRTPLTALKLRLESALISNQGDLRPAVTSALQDVDRLERTVHELLQLARGAPADRKALDFAVILEDAETQWRPRLAQLGRPLRVGIPDGLASVAASDSAVRQILAVLIDNAVVHGSGGVDKTMQELPNGLSIDVRDEGRGVAGDSEWWFQRRQSGHAGSGIGLALAEIAGRGGRRALDPRSPGAGSRVAACTGQSGGRPSAKMTAPQLAVGLRYERSRPHTISHPRPRQGRGRHAGRIPETQSSSAY